MAAKGSAWSDAEKVALLVGIIRTAGGKGPNWKSVAVPKGRTLGSSQKLYQRLLEIGEDVEMVAGANVAPPTPRSAKSGGGGSGKTRKPSATTAAAGKRGRPAGTGKGKATKGMNGATTTVNGDSSEDDEGQGEEDENSPKMQRYKRMKIEGESDSETVNGDDNAVNGDGGASEGGKNGSWEGSGNPFSAV